MKEIGKFIRNLRKKSVYTANKLCELLFITPQCLNCWENGKRDISLSGIALLSSVLDFKVEIKNGEIKMMEEKKDVSQNELVINVKEGIFDIRTVDIEQEIDTNYCIIKVYKPIFNEEDKKLINESDLYFDNKKDLVRQFPNSEIQEEYQLIDKKTGFVPECIKFNNRYAFSNIDNVMSIYMMYLAPIIGYTLNNDEIILTPNELSKNERRRTEHEDNFKKIGIDIPKMNVIKNKLYVYKEGENYKARADKESDTDILMEGFSIVDDEGKQVEGTNALYTSIKSVKDECFYLSSYLFLIQLNEHEMYARDERIENEFKYHMSEEYKHLVDCDEELLI